jgi:hypothetical protein
MIADQVVTMAEPVKSVADLKKHVENKFPVGILNIGFRSLPREVTCRHPSYLIRKLRAIGAANWKRSLVSEKTSEAYLITRSARAKTLGGMVRPSCFAVFRLMTNSNLVGCSMGRSAGLAPLRILST